MTPASTLVYKPGWTLIVKRRADGDMFVAAAHNTDSSDHTRKRTTGFSWRIPDGVRDDRKVWARWVFARLLEAERHEAGEFFAIDGERPFYPNHSEGDPYEAVEHWGS